VASPEKPEITRRLLAVAKRKLRFLSVVVPSPTLNEHLRLEQRVKALHVQQLVPQLAVEGLQIPVLQADRRSAGLPGSMNGNR